MSSRQTADALPKRAQSPAQLANLKGGSRKGVPNKTTTLAKSAIAEAADKLGGTARLVAWCQEEPANERVFWGTIYPKLLPLQLTGEDGGAVKFEWAERAMKARSVE